MVWSRTNIAVGEHARLINGERCVLIDHAKGLGGTHPNPQGHRNIADDILRRIDKIFLLSWCSEIGTTWFSDSLNSCSTYERFTEGISCSIRTSSLCCLWSGCWSVSELLHLLHLPFQVIESSQISVQVIVRWIPILFLFTTRVERGGFISKWSSAERSNHSCSVFSLSYDEQSILR